MGGCGDGVIEFLNDANKIRGRAAGALGDRGGAGAAAGGVSDRHRRHGDHRKRGAPGAFPGRHPLRRNRHLRHRHADDLALMDWLQKYIFPAEAKTVSPEMVRIGTRLAALEMIESGTTTYADMYYFEEEIAKTTREAGLRGVLGQTIIQFPVADAKTPAEGLKRAESFIKSFRNDSLIVPAVAPHALYTNDAATLVACAALGRKYGVPVITHLAETEDEVKIAREQHQATPVGYLESLGFWGPRTLAAHGVWVNDDDIQILKKHGVGVSHNPESNMKLASGTAPVTKYLAAGIALGLGTDGAASNNDLDMFGAMRQAWFLAK